MKIQIINYSKETEDNSICYSSFATPKSPDEFDVNILDLTDEEMWFCGRNLESICCMEDLKNIGIMITRTKKTKILFVLPQDIIIHLFSHTECNNGGKNKKVYDNTVRLKDNLEIVVENIYSSLYQESYIFDTYYENTVTRVGEMLYNAAFYFKNAFEGLTYSESSNKPTTMKYGDSFYLTTLDVFSSEEHLKNYIEKIFFSNDKQEVPAWIDDINFYDDEMQIGIIKRNEEIIENAYKEINMANQRLQNNREIKSILYTTGEELVNTVYMILEKLLDCDLSQFIDKKKEDFLIEKPSYTLIGEIKGVSGNVKNENISQLEVHYQQYMDQLQDNGRMENVHQLLIINPLRDRHPCERDPINEDKIKLANHYGSLIIETKMLLRIYEAFIQNKLTVTDCENILLGKTGLLEERDIRLPESGR